MDAPLVIGGLIGVALVVAKTKFNNQARCAHCGYLARDIHGKTAAVCQRCGREKR